MRAPGEGEPAVGGTEAAAPAGPGTVGGADSTALGGLDDADFGLDEVEDAIVLLALV